MATGEFWSTAYQPTLRATKGYEAIFTQARAEFRQRHDGLEMHTELCVSPEDDVELRRTTLTNHSSTTRVIELTSYAEVVLATQAADEAHPAFSNLFVQTEFVRDSSAILCTRRARSEEEKPPWLLHLMVGQGGDAGRDLVRNRSLQIHRARRDPGQPRGDAEGCAAFEHGRLCPRSHHLAPAHGDSGAEETAVLDFVIGVTESRESALALVEKYQHSRMADRASIWPGRTAR